MTYDDLFKNLPFNMALEASINIAKARVKEAINWKLRIRQIIEDAQEGFIVFNSGNDLHSQQIMYDLQYYSNQKVLITKAQRTYHKCMKRGKTRVAQRIASKYDLHSNSQEAKHHVRSQTA